MLEEEIITFAADVKTIRPADSNRAEVYNAMRIATQVQMEVPTYKSSETQSER